MSDKPLMPKATAVWLIDNTSLTFEQIAEFVGMHPLEVKGIADEDVAKGIKGIDPIAAGQLTHEQVEQAEKDPELKLKMAPAKYKMPHIKAKKTPRYTPVSKRQDKPDAILVAAQPSRIDRCRYHEADRHHQSDDRENPRSRSLEFPEYQGCGSGDAWSVLADRARFHRRTRRPSQAASGEEIDGKHENGRGNDRGPRTYGRREQRSLTLKKRNARARSPPRWSRAQ